MPGANHATYDAVILGAGMSGLAAGIRLAHFGLRVCILERHYSIGGLNSFYRLDGRRFDVGLHALTNFRPSDCRRGPLALLCRQLRIAREDLALAPQIGSAIVFPGARLEFTNDFEHFRAEVHRAFPSQKDNFERLVDELAEYTELGSPGTLRSAREVVAERIDDPLLAEMLFCPILFYGGPRPHDMDFGQFSILFRSIFLEGLARPLEGVRPLLKLLARKFKSAGGELRVRAAAREIVCTGRRAVAVVLENGEALPTRFVLSSAGLRETMALCGAANLPPAGEISFFESISILDTQPERLGLDRTAVFFNDSNRFAYGKPDDLVDLRSGVVCVPNQFAYDEPMATGCVRLTALANYDRWACLSPDAYRAAKVECYQRLVESAARFVPDFRPSVVATDLFTPTTIHRFTGHANGAVYGSPEKRYDGRTHLENLFICGADQGLVGIVGALLSGISMANRHVLQDKGAIRDP
jgi:phytoene dehydrogenase-like protein